MSKKIITRSIVFVGNRGIPEELENKTDIKLFEYLTDHCEGTIVMFDNMNRSWRWGCKKRERMKKLPHAVTLII